MRKAGGQRRSYRAKAIHLTGPDGAAHRFASRPEAAYVAKLWLDPGVRVVELQPRYLLHAVNERSGQRIQVGSYRADVAWIELASDAHHVDDVKGWMAEGMRQATHARLRHVLAQHDVAVRLIAPMKGKDCDRLIALWTAGMRRAA